MKLALFTAAVEKQQDSVLIIELNAENPLRPRFVYANAAFFALTGYGRELEAGTAYPVIIGPKTDRALVIECAKRVAAGETVDCEIQLYRKDGSSFWADVRSHPLDTPAEHCVLIIRDVTELRIRDERLSLLFHALEEASDFVIITDPANDASPEPTIAYVNKSFLDATGYSLSELLGQPGTMFYAKENNPAAMAAIRQNIALGLRNEREAIVQRKDGSTFWIEIVAKPFTTSAGRAYRVIIARDISVRKRTLNQTSLLIGAIEGSRDRVTLYERGPDGTPVVSFENTAAAAGGRHRLLDLLNSDGRIGDELRALVASGGDLVHMLTDRGVDGRLSIIEFSAKAIGGTGEAILTIERFVAEVDRTSKDAASWLVGLAATMVTLAKSSRDSLDPTALQTVLRHAFDVEVREGGIAPEVGVRIDRTRCRANFCYAGTNLEATWSRPLSDMVLTALRLCIEGAIAQDLPRPSHDTAKKA